MTIHVVSEVAPARSLTAVGISGLVNDAVVICRSTLDEAEPLADLNCVSPERRRLRGGHIR